MTTRTCSYLLAMVFAVWHFCSCNCCAEERSKDQASPVVASVLKAYGGADAVGRISSVTATGSIVDFLNGAQGSYARYLERPAKLRIEIMPETGGEVRVLSGQRGWQKTPQGFVEASPVMLQSMVYQYSYLDLPMGFASGTYPVTYGGKRKLDNRKVYLLLVNPRGAPQLRVFIDAKSHLIVRVAADFAMGMMGESELATEYADFRPVAGVLFPHRLVNYAGGTRLSEITLPDIRVNEPIPPRLFAP